MMPDFFREDCRYPSMTDESFGLCDAQDGAKAYPDLANPQSWIAEVRNEHQWETQFVAIDKCVLKDDEFPGRGRCDGMLTTKQHLYLVELKNQEPPWRTHAIEQLESTIEILKDSHDISRFTKRKAFACNKIRDRFVVLDNEFNKMFFHRTSFRIDIQANIVIL